jgi:hypothetical protein
MHPENYFAEPQVRRDFSRLLAEAAGVGAQWRLL